MGNLALVTANTLHVIESLEQETLAASEAITAGFSVRHDVTTGKFTPANGSSAGEAVAYGMATKTVQAGEPVTAIRRGVIEGYDLSALAFDDWVWLSDTDGLPATTTGTVGLKIGSVVPGAYTTIGTAADKLLRVDYNGF